MELTISIKKIGHALGTIGWLAENVDHIKFGQTADGAPGAWLKGKDGKTITILVLGGESGAHNHDGLETVCRRGGNAIPAYPLTCDIYTTDACWEVIEQIAELARQQMREPSEIAKSYTVTVV